MYVHSPDSVPWIETSNLKIRRLIFDCLSMATQQISEFSLKQKRLRYEQICKTAHRCEIEWHLQIQKRCRFFWGFFFGGIFFVFQSGHIVISYNLYHHGLITLFRIFWWVLKFFFLKTDEIYENIWEPISNAIYVALDSNWTI